MMNKLSPLKGKYKELKNVNAGTMDLEIVEENGHTCARPKAMTNPAVRFKDMDPAFAGQNRDSHTLLEYLLGHDKMKKYDEVLDNNKAAATRMFDDFETSQVYHTMHLADGDVALTEKTLREFGFKEWIDNLDKEKVVKKFEKNPKLKRMYIEMDPKVQRTCTFCESPCDIICSDNPELYRGLEPLIDAVWNFPRPVLK